MASKTIIKPTAADVDSRIAVLTDATKRATKQLTSGWWQNSQEEAMSKTLDNSQPTRDRWAEMGRTAIAKGSEPSGGWAAWLALGRRLLDTVNEILATGERGVLDDLPTAIIETATHAAKKTAKVATEAATVVAHDVGTVANAAVQPVLLPLVVIVGCAVALVLVLKQAGVLS